MERSTVVSERQDAVKVQLPELPQFDLTHVLLRLKSIRTELREADFEKAELQYREYLAGVKLDPRSKMQPPSKLADDIWHTHIYLSTSQYAADCEAYFGYFLDHEAICDAGGCDHGASPRHHKGRHVNIKAAVS